MRSLMVVLSLALGFSIGCGGKSGLEGEVEGWKDKMCACKDKECAEKTYDDYKEWRRGKKGEAKDMSKDDMGKIMTIERELKDCRDKLDKPAAAPTP